MCKRSPSSNDYTVPNCLWCQLRPKKMKEKGREPPKEEILIVYQEAFWTSQTMGRKAGGRGTVQILFFYLDTY